MDVIYFIERSQKVSLWHVVPDINCYQNQDFSIDIKLETVNDNWYK